MANIENVPSGSRLNGTWERGLGTGQHPPGWMKAAKGSQHGSNPMNVAGSACRDGRHEIRPGRDNARRRVCYGARSTVLEEPVHEWPAGRRQDVPVNERSGMGSLSATATKTAGTTRRRHDLGEMKPVKRNVGAG